MIRLPTVGGWVYFFSTAAEGGLAQVPAELEATCLGHLSGENDIQKG